MHYIQCIRIQYKDFRYLIVCQNINNSLKKLYLDSLYLFTLPPSKYILLVDFKALIGFQVQKYKKIQPPKIALLGLYLYYQASYSRFTDFLILQHRFQVAIFLRYYLCLIQLANFLRYFLYSILGSEFTNPHRIFFSVDFKRRIE